MEVYIRTLGSFDVRIGEKSLLEEAKRSYRIYKLLQYFITFRNKKLLAENIIENLWDEHESLEPKNILRAQIFRIRQTLKKLLPDEDGESYFNISFQNGYYSLQIGKHVSIDVDEFEALIREGDANTENDINHSINCYKKALELYKGPYLEENPYEMWLVPVRNYYSRLYFKTLSKLIEIYREMGKHEDIIEICETAISIEPYNEITHIYLIEAMLGLGQIREAISHYEHIVPILEKESGNKPSLSIKDMYKKIENYLIDKNEMPLTNIKDKLEENNLPLHCDFDYFKFVYNVRARKRLNQNELDYIGSITIKCERCAKDELKEWSVLMNKLLERSLRKGDIFTFWNETQILILLNDSKVV
jgi:DNA-binding SARP family transcriptional activator